MPRPRLHRLSAGFSILLHALFLSNASHGADLTASNVSSRVIVVAGAPGEEEFGRQFAAWADNWERAARLSGARFGVFGLATNLPTTDHDLLRQTLEQEPKDGPLELWLVLMGHGTFDGREARFNLRGPDLTATELGEWLKPFSRPIAIIDASSSSGPFLNKLSATNRVVITATRSGHEANYARFGQYLSESVGQREADLDKDGQTSLLEAFLWASRGVAEFYKGEGRLVTEHPLLDDNGDTMGTPPDWFRGVRAVKSAKNGTSPDGLRAHQLHLIRNDEDQKLSAEARARRNQIEAAIEKLRGRKVAMTEEAYYAELEQLALQLARVYESSGP